ncbi:MAG: hypothetical protein LRY55_05635 [Leadbetterella sp.]|nr:hypothetical protein [Leadbetterella sp.]
MKKLFLLLLTAGAFLITLPLRAQDNPELQKMADADQSARMSSKVDWRVLNREDSLRRKRILELLREGKVITARDHYNSGIVFHARYRYAFVSPGGFPL